MNRLGRYRWGPALLVEAASFVLAFAVFAAAGGAYAALSGNTGRPIWWVLLPAAAVVAILLPLARPWITAAVDRLAHGQKAEGYRLMSDLMARMAATLEVDEVLPRLAETAARSVHSERGEVSVWLADGRQWRRTWTPEPGGAAAGAPASAGDQEPRALEDPAVRQADAGDEVVGDEVMVEVQHLGDVVGELGVGLAGPELSAADRRALNDLAAPAGVALATVRLTVELRRRVAEVAEQTRALQASRQRLVDARRLEQERTWNRLSARVIPRIEAIAGSLPRLPATLPEGGTATLPEGSTATLPEGSTARGAAPSGEAPNHPVDIARHATDALEELREVARGIFPALLTDSGLEVALQAWTERRSPGRTVACEGDLQPLHRQPAAEAALYYACTLTAEETAGAPAGNGGPRTDRPPPLRLSSDGVTASVTIALPAAPAEGVLRAVLDRLEALGGSLRLDPADGATPDPIGDPAGRSRETGQGTGPVVLVATVPLEEP